MFRQRLFSLLETLGALSSFRFLGTFSLNNFLALFFESPIGLLQSGFGRRFFMTNVLDFTFQCFDGFSSFLVIDFGFPL
jgi:hypothetical protein